VIQITASLKNWFWNVYASGWQFHQVLFLVRGGLRPGDVFSMCRWRFFRPVLTMKTVGTVCSKNLISASSSQ